MTKLEVLQATRNCAGTNIRVEKDCNVKIRDLQRQLRVDILKWHMGSVHRLGRRLGTLILINIYIVDDKTGSVAGNKKLCWYKYRSRKRL